MAPVTMPTSKQFVNRTGHVYGELTVLEYAGLRKAPTGPSNSRSRTAWLCRCNCGDEVVILADALAGGHSTTCGKHLRENHGESKGYKKSPEMLSFRSAKGRCTNPRNPAFHDYGGRGIEFRYKSLAEFLADVGRRPTPKHSLDRKETNGHYEPGNCRWATRLVQNNNRRDNRLIDFRGETDTLPNMARKHGVAVHTIENRLLAGWCIECTMTIPPRGGLCPHKAK